MSAGIISFYLLTLFSREPCDYLLQSYFQPYLKIIWYLFHLQFANIILCFSFWYHHFYHAALLVLDQVLNCNFFAFSWWELLLIDIFFIKLPLTEFTNHSKTVSLLIQVYSTLGSTVIPELDILRCYFLLSRWTWNS